MQQPNKKISQKPWYKKPWGLLIIILSVFTLTFPIVLLVLMWQSGRFPKWVKISVIIFIVIIAVGAASSEETSKQSTQDNQVAQTALTAEEKAKQQAEDEAAAKEITKILIEGYVPKYCANHQDRKIPLPYEKDGSWQYDINNPTTKLTEQECRNVITYLVNNVGSSAQSLEAISEAKISIGMNVHELQLSWGLASDINNTTTAAGKSSQWVYGNPIYGASYVYLDNDVITAIQN